MVGIKAGIEGWPVVDGPGVQVQKTLENTWNRLDKKRARK